MSLASRRILRIAAPVSVAAIVASMVLGAPAGADQAPVGLGAATSFSVLGGSAITNTGATTVNGDIGSFPTPTITGLGPGADQITFQGAAVNHGGDAVTQLAKDNLQTAYDDASGRLPQIAQDAELGGELLTQGVYVGGATGLTGTLKLDFQGSATAQFIFKLTELTTASASKVEIVNPSGPNDACRVVWRISSSATFGTQTDFVGDVLAHTSITANNGADFNGRLLALGGAVTLNTNTINIGSCALVPAQVVPPAIDFGNGGGGGGGVTIPTTSTTRASTSTTSTTRPTTTTSTTAAPTTTTTSMTSTTLPTVVATTGGTPEPTTINPSGPGQGEQSPQSPPTPTGLPELPRTGTSTLVLALSGAVLVVLGSAAVHVERRARSAQLV